MMMLKNFVFSKKKSAFKLKSNDDKESRDNVDLVNNIILADFKKNAQGWMAVSRDQEFDGAAIACCMD